jgi:hypothetical protein
MHISCIFVRARVDRGSIPLHTAVGVFCVYAVNAALLFLSPLLVCLVLPVPCARAPCSTPGVEHTTILTRTSTVLGVCLPRWSRHYKVMGL